MPESRMSRGEMIRRLDDMAAEVGYRLTNGPLTADERHHLADTLGVLLPLVAEALQHQLDQEAAAALLAWQKRSALEQDG